MSDPAAANAAHHREKVALVILTPVCMGISAIGCNDRFTWFLEVLPILIALPMLVLTRRWVPLTMLSYRLLFLHGLILMVGGHYTYAQVPVGNWVRDTLHLARNPYDRLGHLAQGFVPAIVVREVLQRRTLLRPGGWLFFLVACVCLAFSACYEFFEWAAAVTTGTAADAFLGTQGDPWDTQWDMLCALIGAIMAQLMLARYLDRQVAGDRA